MLRGQLERVHELLEVETIGGGTDVDINAMVANNQGNKDELKPPFIRRTPIKWLQNRIPVYSACSGFGDVMGKAVRDSGIGTLVLAADVDPAARAETTVSSRCNSTKRLSSGHG